MTDLSAYASDVLTLINERGGVSAATLSAEAGAPIRLRKALKELLSRRAIVVTTADGKARGSGTWYKARVVSTPSSGQETSIASELPPAVEEDRPLVVLTSRQRIMGTLALLVAKPGLTARQIGLANGDAPDRYRVVTLYYRMLLGMVRDELIVRDPIAKTHETTRKGRALLLQMQGDDRQAYSALSHLTECAPGRPSPKRAAKPSTATKARKPKSFAKQRKSRAVESVDRKASPEAAARIDADVRSIKEARKRRTRLPEMSVEMLDDEAVDNAILWLLNEHGDHDAPALAKALGDVSAGQSVTRQAIFGLVGRRMLDELPKAPGKERRYLASKSGADFLALHASGATIRKRRRTKVVVPTTISSLRAIVDAVLPALVGWTFVPDLVRIAMVPKTQLLEALRWAKGRGELLHDPVLDAWKSEEAHFSSRSSARIARLRDAWQGLMTGRHAELELLRMAGASSSGKRAISESIRFGHLIRGMDGKLAAVTATKGVPFGYKRAWTTPIGALSLDARIVDELRLAGLSRAGDLVRLDPLDLENHPTLPRGTGKKVRQALMEQGLDFRTDVSPLLSMACLEHRMRDFVDPPGSHEAKPGEMFQPPKEKTVRIFAAKPAKKPFQVPPAPPVSPVAESLGLVFEAAPIEDRAAMVLALLEGGPLDTDGIHEALGGGTVVRIGVLQVVLDGLEMFEDLIMDRDGLYALGPRRAVST